MLKLKDITLILKIIVQSVYICWWKCHAKYLKTYRTFKQVFTKILYCHNFSLYKMTVTGRRNYLMIPLFSVKNMEIFF